FCEKPLDLDLRRARESVDIAARADVLLCLGFNRRHDPDFRKLRMEARSGAIGPIEVITIISRDPAPPPPEYIERSGGLFRDMMIHDLDMGRWLLGEEPQQVFATGSTLADPRIGKLGDIDTAVAVLRTPSGRLCHITNSRRCSYGYDQRIEVFGSRGMVRVDNRKITRVEKATTRGFATEPALPFFLERYAQSYRLQLDRFIRAVGGESTDLALGSDGLRALELAEAAHQSFRLGRPVDVS
ncbi:MAG: inositol 2-dehydrogenase, partial [Proteobacteria bacterium]|nr:inositol 2-dehydrogenase [Pseudomonadota bacterium]